MIITWVESLINILVKVMIRFTGLCGQIGWSNRANGIYFATIHILFSRPAAIGLLPATRQTKRGPALCQHYLLWVVEPTLSDIDVFHNSRQLHVQSHYGAFQTAAATEILSACHLHCG